MAQKNTNEAPIELVNPVTGEIETADERALRLERDEITHKGQIDGRALTAESIAADVAVGIDALARALFEGEQRVLADNGKRYPLDASLPDGVTSDGTIVEINRYGFLQRQLIGCVVWKLESMLEQQDQRIVEQRSKIRNARRDMDLGRTTEAMISRMADFFETLVDQRTVVLNAFNAARVAHADVLEEEFETRAMKAERERFARASRAPSAINDRLARLGC